MPNPEDEKKDKIQAEQKELAEAEKKRNAFFSLSFSESSFSISPKEEEAFQKKRQTDRENYKRTNPEPNWQRRRDILTKKYKSEIENAEFALNSRISSINSAADFQIAVLENDTRVRKEAVLPEMRNQALVRFPDPKVQLAFLREKNAQAPANGESTFYCTFTKNDREMIEEIQANKKVSPFRKKPMAEDFRQMQDALREFTNAFQEGALADNPQETLSRIQTLKSLLKTVKDNSHSYLERNKGFKWSIGCRNRKKLASYAEQMAEDQLQSLTQLEESYGNLAAERQESRDTFVAGETEKEMNRLDSVLNAKKAPIQAKKEKDLREARESGEERLRNIRQHKENEFNNLEKEELTYKGKALSGSFGVSSGANVSFGSYKTVDDLSDRHRGILACSMVADTIFDPKHNPFSHIRKGGEPTTDPDKFIRNEDMTKNAMNMNALKSALSGGKPPIPVTYTPDAMASLANLQLFDSMIGIDRAKNDYSVDFFFEKDGTVLDSSALRERGAEALSKDGYRCFVSGVHAELPIPNSGNVLSGNRTRELIHQGQMIPKETHDRIQSLDFSKMTLPLPKLSDPTLPDPSKALQHQLTEVQKAFLLRKSKSTLDRDNIRNMAKFNVMDMKRLTRDALEGVVDARPVRPSAKLKDNKFIKPGILDSGSAYFDEELLSNIALNGKGKIISRLNEEQQKKISVETSFTLFRNEKESDKLAQLLGQEQTDPALKDIAGLLTEMKGMKGSSCFDFNTRYETRNGVQTTKPEGNSFVAVSDFRNAYDKKAAELYKAVSSYCRNHPENLKNPDSPASLLSSWAKDAYPSGLLVSESGNPDITSIRSSDAENEQDYLFNAKLFYQKENLWNIGTENRTIGDSKGLNKQEVFLKPFRDEPLFTREPAFSDLNQGILGNCYFLATLSAQIGNDPKKIREMMHDNNDGTVTCRFYDKFRQPIEVKVDKTVAMVRPAGKDSDVEARPVTNENAPLWFHILQKGYMMSGLRLDNIDPEYDPSEKETYLKHAKSMLNLPDDAAEDTIKKELVKARHTDENGNLTKQFTDEEIEDEFQRLFTQSQDAMSGGFLVDVFRNMEGKQCIQYYFADKSADDCMLLLHDFSKNLESFAGKNPDLEALDPKMVDDLGKAVAGRLSVSKVHVIKDLEGKEQVCIETISLEVMEQAIKDVASDPSKVPGLGQYAVDPGSLRNLKDCAEKITNAMHAYQMGTPDKSGVVLVSEKEGNYSKHTEDLFDRIKNVIDKKQVCACGFKGKTNTSDSDADLPTLVEGLDNDGTLHLHEYTVMDYRIADDGKKYVLVRNPWGTGGRQKNEVELVGKDGTESFRYNSINMSDKGLGEESGLFEMELNDFASTVNDIEYDTGKQLLSRSAVCKSIAKSYLTIAKNDYTAEYNQAVQKVGGEAKLLGEAMKSDLINGYAEKLMAVNETRELIEAGADLPPDNFKETSELESELKSFLKMDKAPSHQKQAANPVIASEKNKPVRKSGNNDSVIKTTDSDKVL